MILVEWIFYLTTVFSEDGPKARKFTIIEINDTTFKSKAEGQTIENVWTRVNQAGRQSAASIESSSSWYWGGGLGLVPPVHLSSLAGSHRPTLHRHVHHAEKLLLRPSVLILKRDALDNHRVEPCEVWGRDGEGQLSGLNGAVEPVPRGQLDRCPFRGVSSNGTGTWNRQRPLSFGLRQGGRIRRTGGRSRRLAHPLLPPR